MGPEHHTRKLGIRVRKFDRERLNNSFQTVFLTGASGGIGSAINNKLKTLGYNIIAPTHQELDLSNIGSLKKYIDEHKNDPIDILINCAAINPAKVPFDEMDAEQIDEVIRVDLTAPLLLSRGLTSHMKEKGWGRIVNIGSIWGKTARYPRAAYAASKRGLDSITESFAAELGKYGILVNSLHPGFVDTEMTRRNLSEEQIAAFLVKVPTGKIIQPSEIADVIAFLVSKKNKVITGQSIAADGGFLTQN